MPLQGKHSLNHWATREVLNQRSEGAGGLVGALEAQEYSERRQRERVRAQRDNTDSPGNSLLQSAQPWVKGDPRLVMLPGRQLPFHIKLFGAHLISKHEQFRVTQHQARPYVLVLFIVPGFWQRTLLSRPSTIFHCRKLLDKVVFSSLSSLHSSTCKGPGSTLGSRALIFLWNPSLVSEFPLSAARLP